MKGCIAYSGLHRLWHGSSCVLNRERVGSIDARGGYLADVTRGLGALKIPRLASACPSLSNGR